MITLATCDYCSRVLNGHCYFIRDVGKFCEQCVIDGMTEYYGNKLLRDGE